MKIGKPETVAASVEVLDRAGEVQTLALDVRLLGFREQRAILRHAQSVSLSDAAFLLEYIAGFNVDDEDGEPLALTERNMARLLDKLGESAVEKIVQACVRACDEAARGN